MASVPAPQSRAALNVRPFFEDKARAFWTLQAVGWGGYLVLRGVSAISNGPSLEVIVPVIVETILGYCITLLLSTLYGYYRSLPRVTGVLLTIATLFTATLLYAVLDTVNFSYIQTAQTGLSLTRLLASMYVCFTVLAGWSALYFGINFYLIVEEQIDQMRDLEVQASSAQLAMLRYQLNPHFLFNTLNSISTLVLLKQTERANAMLSRLVGDRVQIAVSDTGPGLQDGPSPASLSTGVGLQNIRDRLIQAYGPDQRLITRTASEGGFSVAIDIPLQVDSTKRDAA
jgi:hypothetical protein